VESSSQPETIDVTGTKGKDFYFFLEQRPFFCLQINIIWNMVNLAGFVYPNSLFACTYECAGARDAKAVRNATSCVSNALSRQRGSGCCHRPRKEKSYSGWPRTRSKS